MHKNVKQKETFQISVQCVVIWVVWLKEEKTSSGQVALWEAWGNGLEPSDPGARLECSSASPGL